MFKRGLSIYSCQTTVFYYVEFDEISRKPYIYVGVLYCYVRLMIVYSRQDIRSRITVVYRCCYVVVVVPRCSRSKCTTVKLGDFYSLHHLHDTATVYFRCAKEWRQDGRGRNTVAGHRKRADRRRQRAGRGHFVTGSSRRQHRRDVRTR